MIITQNTKLAASQIDNYLH